MNKGINIIAAVIFIIVFLFASGAFYLIDETQQVVLTQFGRLIGQKSEAGLYFKIPFIQTVNYFDKRVLIWDGDANNIQTLEKRFIWVDTTARWRIKDALKFMQSVRTENSAQSRLDDIIDASTRDIISTHRLSEAVRSSNRILEKNISEGVSDFGKTALEEINEGREELSRKILKRAAPAVADYGIELVDVRIKRLNYVRDVRNKVYERMVAERKRAAEQFRSEGQGKRAEIAGQRLKDLQEIQSEAYKTAQEIKGKADAEAIKIYAEAYNKDPEFYSFIKTLDTYRETIGDDTTLFLSTDSDFFKYLKNVNAGSGM